MAAGYLLDRHVQALLGKQPVVLCDAQADQVDCWFLPAADPAS
jgi:hypothetical protein